MSHAKVASNEVNKRPRRNLQTSLGVFRKSIQCSFCYGPLKDPVSTLCNHQFCRKCITDFIKKTKTAKCPRCEARVLAQHLKGDESMATFTQLVGNLANEIGNFIAQRQQDKIRLKHAKDAKKQISSSKDSAKLHPNEREKEKNSKSTRERSKMDSRNQSVTIKYNYIVPEDLSARNKIPEPPAKPVTSKNDSAAPGFRIANSNLFDLMKSLPNENTVDDNNDNETPVLLPFDEQEKTHSKESASDEEEKIFPKESTSEEEINFKSRQLLETSKILDSSPDLSPTNNVMENEAPDPYEFIPSQKPVPEKQGRGRGRGRGRTRRNIANKINGNGHKAKRGGKRVSIEKAEAYHNLYTLESSGSEDEDLYRLFITPKITEEEINERNGKSRSTKRRLRGGGKSTKRKSNADEEQYADEFKAMAEEIEDAEQHDLTMSVTKRRKIDNEKMPLPKSDEELSFEIDADQTGVCRRRIKHVEKISQKGGGDASDADSNVDEMSVDEIASDGDNAKDMDTEDSSKLKKGLHCSFSPDNCSDDDLPSFFDIPSSDEPQKPVAKVDDKKQAESDDDMLSIFDEPQKPVEKVDNEKQSEINSRPSLFETIYSSMCSEKSSTEPLVITPEPQQNLSKIMIVDDYTASEERDVADQSQGSSNDMFETDVPSTVEAKNNAQETTSKNVITPLKNIPVKTNVAPIAKIIETRKPDVNLLIDEETGPFSKPSEQIVQVFQSSTICGHCGNSVSTSVQVVSFGTQTDFEFSSTDIIKYPTTRQEEKFENPIDEAVGIETNPENDRADPEPVGVAIDEAARSSYETESHHSNPATDLSVIPGSVQTPPAKVLTFENIFNDEPTGDLIMDIEIDYNNVGDAEIDLVKARTASPKRILDVEEDEVLNTTSNDIFLSQTQPLHIITETETTPKKIVEVEGNDYKESPIDEDIFSAGGKRDKYLSGQSSTPKIDFNASSVKRNENVQKHSEDDEGGKSLTNIFEKYTPTAFEGSPVKSKTRRGLARIINAEKNKNQLPKQRSLFDVENVNVAKETTVTKEKTISRESSGSSQTPDMCQNSPKPTNTESLSQDVILPTPKSKTGAGRSFINLTDDESDKKRRKTNDSGYTSFKSARKSLINELDMESKGEENRSPCSDSKIEDVEDECLVSAKEIVGKEPESEAEKLRRKHQSFLEGVEEVAVIEPESRMEEGNEGQLHVEDVTDSDMLRINLEEYDDNRLEEEEETVNADTPEKATTSKKSNDRQVLFELTKSLNNSSSEQSTSKDTVNSDVDSLNLSRNKSKSKLKSQRRESVIEEPIPEEKMKSFIASGLAPNEMAKVQLLAHKIGGDFRLKFCAETSHVIVKTGRDLITNRTLKYLQGIANKRWIVNFDWVTNSLQKGFLQDEKGFEVIGDRVQGGHKGPTRSRCTKELLLKDYEICCLGDFSDISKDDVVNLATVCGASSVFSPAMFSYKQGSTQLLLLQAINPRIRSGIQDKCNKYNATAIVRDWVLDSISQYRVLPIQTYPHLNPSV